MQSFFDHPEYEWRETLFVLFDEKSAPALTADSLGVLLAGPEPDTLAVERAKYAADGRLLHARCISQKTRCAVEVIYRAGQDVRRQTRAFYESIREILEPHEHRQWKRLLTLSACYELVYFELPEPLPAGERPTMYDPGSLLFLMEKITQFLGGTAVDPQSGMILEVD